MIFRFLVIFKRSGLRKQKSRWKRTKGVCPVPPLLFTSSLVPSDTKHFCSRWFSLLLFPDSQRLIFWLLSFFFFLYVVFLLSGHFLSLSKTSTMSVNFLCAVLRTMRGCYNRRKQVDEMNGLLSRCHDKSMKKWSPVLDEAARPISSNAIKTVGPSSCNSISSCSDEDECRDMVLFSYLFSCSK